MKHVIYKYAVSPAFTLDLPQDAQVLSVQEQSGMAQMWVLLCPDVPTITRHFVAIPTGMPFDATGKRYIATFQMDWMVFHLFEDEV